YHTIEAAGEFSEFIPVRRTNPMTQIAFSDPLHRLAHATNRQQKRADEQHGNRSGEQKRRNAYSDGCAFGFFEKLRRLHGSRCRSLLIRSVELFNELKHVLLMC